MKGLGPRGRDIAVAGWSSFLAACLGSLLAFSQVDPALMGDALTPARELTRLSGYGAGFFLFWLVGLVASGLALFLARTGRSPGTPR